MPKIKLTPLNIVVSLCLAYAVYCLLGLDSGNLAISTTAKVGYTLALTLILFLTDILFRRFIKGIKWLWLIQGSFVLLIIVMMIIAKKI
jgi:F0F1-type ATP synthase membrane subunit a